MKNNGRIENLPDFLSFNSGQLKFEVKTNGLEKEALGLYELRVYASDGMGEKAFADFILELFDNPP